MSERGGVARCRVWSILLGSVAAVTWAGAALAQVPATPPDTVAVDTAAAAPDAATVASGRSASSCSPA